MKLFWILLLLSFGALAQDEMMSELDKLDSGEVETSTSTESPIETTEEDLEAELNAAPEPEQTVEAPDTLPEDLTEPQEAIPPTDEAIAAPEEIVPPAPELLPENPENFETVEEAPLEDQLEPAVPDESFVEEESQDSLPPEPVVEETLQPQPTYSEAPVSSGNTTDFEARLNRIYNQFYREAISDDSWKEIAGERINESYTVQPGDTLWDISVTFFGNGHYWPKVWQLNDDITNPHLITAGYMLKFVPGQLNQAPQLNITQGEGGVAPSEAVADTSVSVLPQEELAPVIPPPTIKSRAVLMNLPPSLPMLVAKQYAEFDDDGFSREKPKVAMKSTIIHLTSYLADTKPESLGEVVEGDLGDIETAGVYDHIFVKLDAGAQPNDRFLIFTTGDSVKAADSGRSGYPVYCHAEIRVIENVNADKNIYKAIVTKSVFPLKVGSSVAKGTIPMANVEDEGGQGSTSGEVMGGDFEEERFLFGPQQTVYIDRGSEDGVQEGQIFSIRKNDRLRKSGTLVKEMKDQIARIKVLKTNGKVSTAVVLNSKEDVLPGDRFTAMLNGEAPVLRDIEMNSSPREESIPELDPETEFEEEETDEFIE